MSNDYNKKENKDIHQRIYNFVIRVLDLVKALPKTPENLIITPQIIASVTSMGANDQEADACESRRDFIAKYSIVKKENKETNYWLRLIYDRNPEFRKRMENLTKEGEEILRIVSSIIYKTRNAKRNL